MLKLGKVFVVLLIIVQIAVLSGCAAGGKASTKKPDSTQQSQTSDVNNQQPAQTSGLNTASNEQPLAPEKNPPGDIPDTQVFVKYKSSSGGYQLKVPEGWSRKINGTDVSFIDKFDGIEVKITKSSSPLTVKDVQNNQAAELKKNGRAVQIKNIQNIQLSGGNAVLIVYESNSEQDPVTNKQVRLENNSYLFYKDGKLATLTLWAPAGSDNVDQWKLISDSFRWD